MQEQRSPCRLITLVQQLQEEKCSKSRDCQSRSPVRSSSELAEPAQSAGISLDQLCLPAGRWHAVQERRSLCRLVTLAQQLPGGCCSKSCSSQHCALFWDASSELAQPAQSAAEYPWTSSACQQGASKQCRSRGLPAGRSHWPSRCKEEKVQQVVRRPVARLLHLLEASR